jgi:hypothetical protein
MSMEEYQMKDTNGSEKEQGYRSWKKEKKKWKS